MRCSDSPFARRAVARGVALEGDVELMLANASLWTVAATITTAGRTGVIARGARPDHQVARGRDPRGAHRARADRAQPRAVARGAANHGFPGLGPDETEARYAAKIERDRRAFHGLKSLSVKLAAPRADRNRPVSIVVRALGRASRSARPTAAGPARVRRCSSRRSRRAVLGVGDVDEREAPAQPGHVDELLVVAAGVDVGPADGRAQAHVVDRRVLAAGRVDLARRASRGGRAACAAGRAGSRRAWGSRARAAAARRPRSRSRPRAARRRAASSSRPARGSA